VRKNAVERWQARSGRRVSKLSVRVPPFKTYQTLTARLLNRAFRMAADSK